MAGISLNVHACGVARSGVLLMVSAAALLSGCRVLTLQEDRALRARQGSGIDARAEVRRTWQSQALPALDRAAQPLAQLLPAIEADLPGAGARFGRRTGEGAPWTFVGRGSGIVAAVDTESRRGTIEVRVATASGPRAVRLQIGPVVAGTAVRDALPSIAFNDYPDQLVFADVGHELTTKALAAVRPAVGALRPGAKVVFFGAFNLAAGDDAVLITPVALTAGSSNGG